MFRLLNVVLKASVTQNWLLRLNSFFILNIPSLAWSKVDNESLVPNHQINLLYEHLITRIDPKLIEAMTEANKENLVPQQSK